MLFQILQPPHLREQLVHRWAVSRAHQSPLTPVDRVALHVLVLMVVAQDRVVVYTEHQQKVFEMIQKIVGL